MPNLCHKDTIVFVELTNYGYGNKKNVIAQHDVMGTFIQNTGFLHTTNQDIINSDAILFPDHKDAFIISAYNRLEGMCIIAPVFGGDPDDAWYKITSVTVNRDHLLGNKIDNIQVLLKKTEALPGVS